MKRTMMIALSTTALLCTAGMAQAAFRIVPSQYETIQSAVDAAAQGDTVLIRPGEYRESVNVDVDGLTIRGMACARRSAVVDGGLNATVFEIDAEDVTLACMTLRHGGGGIYADDGDGLTVDRLSILSPRGDGIYLGSGNGFQINNSSIVSATGYGVNVGEGLQGSVTGTTVRGAGDSCFYVEGADELVFNDNMAHGCGYHGVELYGTDVSLSRNTLRAGQRGLYVYGDGAQVADTRVESSCYNDYCVYLEGSDATISRSVISNAYYDAIYTDGDRNTIEDSVVNGVTDDYCFEFYGNDTVATGNRCTGAYYGLYASGDNVEIRGNTLDSTLYEPLSVYGSDNQVLENTVRNSYDGFIVDGTDMLVQNNQASAVTWSTFYIYGENPRVLDNSGDSGSYSVFDIYCYDDCTSADVSRNFASNGVQSKGGAGFVIGADASGMNISNNTSEDNLGLGMQLYIDEATIASNVVRRNGFPSGGYIGLPGERGGSYARTGSGIFLSGDDNTLTGNQSSDNLGAGFEIEGSYNTLSSNIAERNLLEGFWLWGGAYGNELSGNTARRNNAEGIDNQGAETNLLSNTSSGNRTDCTSDGSVDEMSDNVCDDSSDFEMNSQIGQVID